MASKKIVIYFAHGYEYSDDYNNTAGEFSAYFLKKEHAKIAIKSCIHGFVDDVPVLQTDSGELFIDIHSGPVKTIELKDFLLQRAQEKLSKEEFDALKEYILEQGVQAKMPGIPKRKHTKKVVEPVESVVKVVVPADEPFQTEEPEKLIILKHRSVGAAMTVEHENAIALGAKWACSHWAADSNNSPSWKDYLSSCDEHIKNVISKDFQREIVLEANPRYEELLTLANEAASKEWDILNPSSRTKD